MKDMRGHTAIHYLFFKGEMLGLGVELDTVLELTDSVMNVARDLINHGVDVNSVDNLGLTPVHLAAARMPSRVLELLIKHGGLIDSQNKMGRTPLHLSVHNTDPAVLSCLHAHNADLKLKDMSKRAVLHWAARFEKPEVIWNIIDHINLKVSTTRDVHGYHSEYINTPMQSQTTVSAYLTSNQILPSGFAEQKTQDCHGCLPAHYVLSFKHHADITKMLRTNQANKEGIIPLDMLYIFTDNIRGVVTGENMTRKEYTSEHSGHIALSNDELFEDDKMEQVDCYVVPSSLRKIDDPEEFVSKIWEHLDVKCSERNAMFSAIDRDVHVFFKSLMRNVSKKDSRFAGMIFPTESANEGTKIEFPNEFDFI